MPGSFRCHKEGVAEERIWLHSSWCVAAWSLSLFSKSFEGLAYSWRQRFVVLSLGPRLHRTLRADHSDDVGQVESENGHVQEWQQDRTFGEGRVQVEGHLSQPSAEHLGEGDENRLSARRSPRAEHRQEEHRHRQVLAEGRVCPVPVVELVRHGQDGAEARR
jgi:hypothetical protein